VIGEQDDRGSRAKKEFNKPGLSGERWQTVHKNVSIWQGGLQAYKKHRRSHYY
jgi:hypothetical protein